MAQKKTNSSTFQRILCVTTLAPLIIILLLLGIITLRTMLVRRPSIERRLQSILPAVPRVYTDVNVTRERMERLAGAIKIPTVSYPSDQADRQDFQALLDLHNYLRKNFPLVHNCSYVKLDVINTYSLLYSVTGTDNRGRLPYLLASHLDVVTANPDTWEVDPFGGIIVNDTYVYGRGTVDDKGGVLAILEAVEYMISRNEQPKRDFYLAFGHDEEVLGQNGANKIVNELRKRGVKELDFVSDEGSPILRGFFPGITKDVAVIGVTEKGYATLELTVTQTPGHSSAPPRHSAIGILAAAIARIENKQQPNLFGNGPEFAMFQHLLPDMIFGYRAIFSNMWLFSSLLASIIERDPTMNALARTTTAVTIIAGGEKENVLPGSARAVINHRVHPLQSVAEVIEYDRQVINDPRITLKVLSSREPHQVTPSGDDDLPYQLFAATVRQTFPDTLVAPGVLIASTDTTWYLNHTKHIFRFFPTVAGSADLARYHGNNERISIKDYQGAIDFYYRLIRNADALIDPLPLSRPSDEL